MREFEVHLPILLSQHTADEQNLGKHLLPALRSDSVLQSWVGSRTGLRRPTTDRSSRHHPNSTLQNSLEASAPHSIDLSYPRLTSAFRLDYLQERKLDAYRRCMQLLASDNGMAFPTIDIYV